VTLDGVVDARVGLPTCRAMVTPPGGAASESTIERDTQLLVTGTWMPLDGSLEILVLAVMVSTCSRVLVPVKFSALAVTVLCLSVAMPVAVAWAVVAPAGMVSVLWTVPVAGLTVLKVTVKPPAGAGSERVTGNWTVPPGGTSTLGGRTIWFCRTLIAALSDV
jgi:hypothetical protein